MNITTAIYSFHYNKVILKTHLEIKKETDNYYCTTGRKYLKAQIDQPILRHNSKYPYVELVMIDADEHTLKNELSKWFVDKANRVLEETE